MFKVQLQYKNGIEGKIQSLTVFFGREDKQYFYQHKNPDQLRLDLSRLKDADLQNPFCGRYWEFHILNNKDFPDIRDAWKNYMMQHVLV